jgi:ferredoxin
MQGTATTGVVIDKTDLQALIDLLRVDGYRVIAPVVRDGVIVYDEVSSIDELPVGWSDQQEAGSYRLIRRDDNALFGYNVGPQSWKKFFHPERLRLWKANQKGDDIDVIANDDPIPKYALLGVRSCELHAMGIHDTVFASDFHQDSDYLSRRRNALVIAANCTQAGGTCFCDSMQTGPQATMGYDLSLTELLDNGSHRFLMESGSDSGAKLLREFHKYPAADADHQVATSAIQQARGQMGRSMDTTGIKELLLDNLEHPRWDEVASRCLSCANCTMVCPTCFCTTVEDVTDVRDDHAERWRRWDSCFTLDFSYIHGGTVRHSVKSRYRQWMTHKLAYWYDQFDSSGCVGCGRCISWCPVGIDITEELAAIRANGNRPQATADTSAIQISATEDK